MFGQGVDYFHSFLRKIDIAGGTSLATHGLLNGLRSK